MTRSAATSCPTTIEGIQVGDTVYFHVTNLEQDWDVPHGFAVTRRPQLRAARSCRARRGPLAWVPTRVGVFPFYCTDFCSALHQEMQGYIRVSARDAKVALKWNSPSYAQAEEHEAKGQDEHGTH